jgi:hypothetical protein
MSFRAIVKIILIPIVTVIVIAIGLIYFYGDHIPRLIESYYENNPVESVRPFDSYDFSNGGYLLIMVSHFNHAQEFYISDPGKLEQLKSQWVFNKLSPPTKRVYGSTVMLLKDGEVLDRYAVDLSGGIDEVIRISGREYTLDRNLLKGHRTLRSRKLKYEDLKTGRDDIRSKLKDESFVYGPLPIWFYFDGELEFEYSVACWEDESVKDDASLIMAELSKYYSSENFKLEWSQRTLGRDESDEKPCMDVVKYKLACNSQLASKFEAYPISESWKLFDELKWEYWEKEP